MQVELYARRRFDGLRADTPEEETARSLPTERTWCSGLVLGSAPAKLPIPEPCCLSCRELIQQDGTAAARDGNRRITHLLVDAGARDFTWVDPLPGHHRDATGIGSRWPRKVQGRVTVLYERGLDVYAVELHRDGEVGRSGR